MTNQTDPNEMQWINKHIDKMLAGNRVVIITTGPLRAKAMLEQIALVAGPTVKVREHERHAICMAGGGSIGFATISAGDLEKVILASYVDLDEDIPHFNRSSNERNVPKIG